MNWLPLTTVEQVNDLIEQSHHQPSIIFKHSTRCSISCVAKDRFERQFKSDKANAWYLDLLSFREVSNHVAEVFNVEHQSPQVLLIKDGECAFHTSHLDIYADEVEKQIAA